MLKVNPDFESLIPPLSDEEYSGLEKSILEEGVREPIITWRGFIVDGHNRYSIATKHGLDFNTVEYDFADEAAAKEWMILNQFARRNISNYQRSLLALELKPLIAAKAKERHGTRTDLGNFPQISAGSYGETRDELASFAGVSHDTISKVEYIEREAPDELKQQLSSGETSINAAYKQVRDAEKKAEREAAIEEAKAQPRSASYVDIFTTDKKYRVIYADPPWSYNDECKTGGVQSRGASGVYTVMTLEDICKLPIPSQDNAVLFMWTTSPMLEVSFDVINSWGFTYKSSFIWDKVAHNRGHYNSVRHEFLLIAVKGSCTPDVKKLYDSVVSIERTEHSRKPAYFRELIDELYPIGERIELFAREAADGWDVWGDMA